MWNRALYAALLLAATPALAGNSLVNPGFKKFTGSAYVWPWKGGTKDGRAVADHLALFPIPASDLVANPNLDQNNGY